MPNGLSQIPGILEVFGSQRAGVALARSREERLLALAFLENLANRVLQERQIRHQKEQQSLAQKRKIGLTIASLLAAPITGGIGGLIGGTAGTAGAVGGVAGSAGTALGGGASLTSAGNILLPGLTTGSGVFPIPI